MLPPSPEAPPSPRPRALDATVAASLAAAAFGELSSPAPFGLALPAAVESCPWADHRVEPYLPPAPAPPPRPSPPAGLSAQPAAAQGGRDAATGSGLLNAAPDVLGAGGESRPGPTAAPDGAFDGGTEEDDVGGARDTAAGEEGDVCDGRDIAAAEKGDSCEGRNVTAEKEGDTGEGQDIATEEECDTDDGRNVAEEKGNTGGGRDMAAEEERDTDDGRNVFEGNGDTGGGRGIAAAAEDDTDGERNVTEEKGDTGGGRDIAAEEEGDTGEGRNVAGEGRNVAAVEEGDALESRDIFGSDGRDVAAEKGVIIDVPDAKDEDADDYASCFAGTPSPLRGLSPIPCDKEADVESEDAYEDCNLDDFASCVDEHDFGDCGMNSFESFASARASLSVSGTEDCARILESLNVAEVDFQRLTDIVLGSAYWFADLLPKPGCDVGFPGGWRQNFNRQPSDSDRLGGDGCVEVLSWLTSALPNPGGESFAGFEWKSSALCRLYSAAAKPSCRVEGGRDSPPAPAASGLTRQCESPREGLATGGRRDRVGSSACAGRNKDAPRTSSEVTGPSPGSPRPAGSAAGSRSGATAASSLAKNLDLAHVRQLCGVSKAALMKRRAEELSLLRDHYAEVLENATSHLRRWLDDKEQALMRSEVREMRMRKVARTEKMARVFYPVRHLFLRITADKPQNYRIPGMNR
ncbi:MAG: hypothetical protein BJ554DRAFT_7681, partial [Olpidium bornovanus]